MIVTEKSRRGLIFLLPFFLLFTGCVTKGRYNTQVAQSELLSNRLQEAQEKNSALESEIENLKKNLEAMRSEHEAADRAAAQMEKEMRSRAADLEEQLSLSKESENKTEQELREQMARMQRTFQEDRQARQSTLEQMREELAAAQNLLAGQTQEIDQLRSALRLTEEEASKKERELREATRAKEDLIGKLEKEIKDGSIKISQLKDRLSVEIVDKIIFPSGSDRISPQGKEVLKKVSEILKDVKENSIRIEGHTDNVPIGSKIKEKFPSNWELSTSRATQVVRYLVDQGIAPEMLSAVGMSEYRPVASNDSPEGRERNRRIEIVLFPKDLHEIAATVQ